MTMVPRLSRAWPFLLATLASVVIFYPSWARLAEIWLKWEQTMSHGLPTAIAYLALLIVHPPLDSSSRWSEKGFCSRLVGGILLILVTSAWAALELVRIDTLAYLTLPVSLFAIAWTLLGLGGALKLIPYLLLLSLSLPIWADLIPILVNVATVVVGGAVSAMGITALIEGSNITLAYGRLVIADGCSGIGFLAIAMVLGAFTAILNDYRWRGWAMIMSCSIVLALVINWVRIIALVLIADWTNMESSLVREHEMFGWIVFAAFILPALALAPVRRRKTLQFGNDHVISYSASGFILFALVAGSGAVFMVQSREIEEPPLSITGADFREISAPALPLSLQVPDQLEHRFFMEEGTEVYVSLAQIQRHSPEEKIVPYLPPLVDRDMWFREATPAPGKEIWRRISTPQRVVVSHIYAIGAYRTDTYVKAKLLQLPAIYSGRTRFALISLQAACKTSTCEEALDRIAAFEAKTDI